MGHRDDLRNIEDMLDERESPSTESAPAVPAIAEGDTVRIRGMNLRCGDTATVLGLYPKGCATVRVHGGHRLGPGEVYPAYPLGDLEKVELTTTPTSTESAPMANPTPTPETPLRVRLIPPTANSYGNIIWPGKHEPRHGVFPASHPAAPKRKLFGYGTVFSRDEQPKDDPSPLGRFRSLGYYASCFPEGDGISYAPPEGVTVEETAQHIRDCFGWEVRRG